MIDQLLSALKLFISLDLFATFGHPSTYQQLYIDCRWPACMESGSRGLG